MTRWLWVSRPFVGSGVRMEWTSMPETFYHTPIIQTERLIAYEWGGDIRFLIREDLLPVGWKEVFREGSRR